MHTIYFTRCGRPYSNFVFENLKDKNFQWNLIVFSVGKVEFDGNLTIKNKLGKKPTKFATSLSELASILQNLDRKNQTDREGL